MTDQKTVLLATFITRDQLEFTLSKIQEVFNVISSKIFLLKDKNDEQKIVLTYNVEANSQQRFKIPNTISLHRKKETNTLFSINAINEIVKTETGGMLDNKHVINWINYTNCILLSKKNTKEIMKINTELEKVINLSTDASK